MTQPETAQQWEKRYDPIHGNILYVAEGWSFALPGALIDRILADHAQAQALDKVREILDYVRAVAVSEYRMRAATYTDGEPLQASLNSIRANAEQGLALLDTLPREGERDA